MKKTIFLLMVLLLCLSSCNGGGEESPSAEVEQTADSVPSAEESSAFTEAPESGEDSSFDLASSEAPESSDASAAERISTFDEISCTLFRSDFIDGALGWPDEGKDIKGGLTHFGTELILTSDECVDFLNGKGGFEVVMFGYSLEDRLADDATVLPSDYTYFPDETEPTHLYARAGDLLSVRNFWSEHKDDIHLYDLIVDGKLFEPRWVNIRLIDEGGLKGFGGFAVVEDYTNVIMTCCYIDSDGRCIFANYTYPYDFDNSYGNIRAYYQIALHSSLEGYERASRTFCNYTDRTEEEAEVLLYSDSDMSNSRILKFALDDNCVVNLYAPTEGRLYDFSPFINPIMREIDTSGYDWLTAEDTLIGFLRCD